MPSKPGSEINRQPLELASSKRGGATALDPWAAAVEESPPHLALLLGRGSRHPVSRVGAPIEAERTGRSMSSASLIMARQLARLPAPGRGLARFGPCAPLVRAFDGFSGPPRSCLGQLVLELGQPRP